MIKVYRRIAQLVDARWRCLKSDNNGWAQRHDEQLATIERELLPSGSGVDNGTKINRTESTAERLVLDVSFHHMNEVGMYVKWTEHKVIITPSLLHGFDMRITGKNYRQIKDYLGDLYHEALSKDYVEDTSWQGQRPGKENDDATTH